MHPKFQFNHQTFLGCHFRQNKDEKHLPHIVSRGIGMYVVQ